MIRPWCTSLWRTLIEAHGRDSRAGERGQALILWAGAAAIVFGMLGLVVDASNLQSNHRKIQNAVDAAAFAGAYQLPVNPTQATTDAAQWLTKNGEVGSSDTIVTNAVSTTHVANDTITVTIRRNVPYSIMPVLGLGSGSVTATASAQVAAVTSVSTTAANFMPYAVWFQQVDGTPLAIGSVTIFRSDAWVQDNVKNPGHGGTDWTGNSKNFKGYLRSDSSVVSNGDVITSKGGNSCGSEAPYVAQVNAAYNAHRPIIVPVFNHEDGNGQMNLTVAGFVALNVNIAKNTVPFSCPSDFYGQVVAFSTVADGYYKGGASSPSALSCGTGIGMCTPALTQ